MFITKRNIDKNDYYYLEDTISCHGQRKKISIAVSNINSIDDLREAFDELRSKVVVESSKIIQSKIGLNNLSLQEVMEMERLRYNYKLFKKYFKESFESFDNDEFVRFVQGSASVEGNTLSLQEATQVIEKNLSVAGKSISEIREIQNLKNVKEKIISKKPKITERLIRRIHNEVMDGFPEKHPGQYREKPVYITGSDHIPPNAKIIPKLMNEIIDWHSKNKDKIYPVELASYLHVWFESIHPFMDGNGRTGRELLNLVLQENGFPRAIINLDNRVSYISLLSRLEKKEDYFKFSKFLYSVLEKRTKIIENAIDENKELIIKAITKSKK